MSQKNGSSINFIVCLNLTDVNRRFYSIRFDISVEFYRLSGKKMEEQTNILFSC